MTNLADITLPDMQRLLELTPGVHYIAHTSSSYARTFVSVSVKELTGYESAQFTRVPEFWVNHIHPEDRPQVVASLEKSIANDGQAHEYRFHVADQSWRWIHDEWRWIPETQGKRKAIIGTWLDITDHRQAQEALRKSENKYHDLIEGSIQGVLIHCDGKAVFANQAYADIFGYKSPQDILNQDSARDHIAPHERERMRGYTEARIRGEDVPVSYEFEGIHSDGSRIWLENRGRVVEWEERHAILRTVVDITERKQIEKRLSDNEAQLRLVTDNVPATIAYFDIDFCIRFANAQYMRIFSDRASESIIGLHVREIIGEATYREIEGSLLEALAGRRVTYDRLGHGEGGEFRNMEITLVPDITQEGEVSGFFSLGNDVTEQRRTQARIQNLAHHDTLTGLANRALLYDRLHLAIAMARREHHELAVLYIDLDKFKAVNDTQGHAVGDDLLKRAARRIQRTVRDSDTVGRIGGDEFVVILSKFTDRDGTATVARKIIAALTGPFQIDSVKQEIYIGASIGIALYEDETQDLDALLKAADSAMYEAKRVGNSFQFFGATKQ